MCHVNNVFQIIKILILLQAEKCQITEGIQHSLTSGEEYCITVNAKNAGYGAVTCRIRSTSGR
jgi:filamin